MTGYRLRGVLDGGRYFEGPRWQAGRLGNGYLSEGDRRRLSRMTRVEELAELLWSLE